MKTTLLIMAAGINSRFGTGIKQLESVDDARFWAFQRFQPPPLILRKNEGIMSLPCSAIKQARSRGILHEFYTPP